MARPTILISGAGIAGPALAFWLNRNGYKEFASRLRPAFARAGRQSTYAAPAATSSSGWG
jgi:2-polyprenyl-6-methoxyphenol hydroxylase-like FAD-dependent oxidoreductase